MQLPRHCVPRRWCGAVVANKASLPALKARCRATTAATTAADPSMSVEVAKPLCDRRSYQHAVLDNGLRVLAVQDRDAVFAAACANVQAGYFDDQLPGAAHFLEHMVHLGSEAFPDEREYKAFLAAHGGSSNASTSMVHTRYHFKVHAAALGGALARLGAALASPLLAQESAAREVENVHAEYSRNTNSDSRKLLQLKRSLCCQPYSGFSTGSISTLWEEPNAAGVSVPGVLRQLWGACYTAEGTTLAVVGPQETQELLQLVQEAFGGMRQRQDISSSGGGTAPGAGGTAVEAAVSSSESDSSSGSDSSGEEGSDEEAVGAAAATVPAPEAAVHAKAQQEGLPDQAVGVGSEVCSQIAAPQHHHLQHQQQQQSGNGQPQMHVVPPMQQQTPQQQHMQQQPGQGRLRYPVDVVSPGAGGQLVRVCPQRDLRELQVLWYIPAGAMQYSSVKPWHLASHLLGHEVPGSVAHLLKAQGLVQSLSVGMGDEVRLGRGWMFWGATLTLTQEGEDRVEHVLATLLRGVQVLQGCSDAELQQHWQECATLAALKFDWRDQTEPLAAAQAAAYALHYYPPAQVLSGPSLLTSFQPSAIRWFLQQLSPDSMNVFWSSRRHKGLTDSKEPFYGALYAAEPLPQAWLGTIQAYQQVDRQHQGGAPGYGGSSTQQGQDQGPTAAAGSQHQQQESEQQPGQQFAPLPGQLFLPPANWAIPTDLQLRPQEQQQGQAGPPCVVQQAGLCVWHRLDTSYGLPKVHLKLHIVTPAVYASPQAAVCARLLVRVLDDLLLPLAYPAELAGSSYSLSTGQGGLLLKVSGFTGVAQQLLLEVVTALRGLTRQQVQQRFTTMQGRLTQGLTNWANNNPAQHSEYAAHHLLQQNHHHNRDLLAAAAAAQPQHILALQQQLVAGADMHLDMLAYGNISSTEATDLAGRLQQLLPAQGLADPACWPPLGRVFSLSPLSFTGDGGTAAGEEGAALGGCEAASPAAAVSAMEVDSAAATGEAEGEGGSSSGGCGGALCVYLPENPNPSNSNNAVYYWVQLGPDAVPSAVLVELFVQMASKPAFHELRTRQRLGYSVHLSSTSLQRQLGLVVRVQSPATAPDAVTAAVRGWMAGFRAELLQLAQDSLDSHKQSLLDKYLEPPKSLHEAASRAWLPIGSSRSLVFNRRQQKAAAVQAVTQQQLLDWYDQHVHPTGGRHHALCVQVWGGAAAAPAHAAEAVAAVVQGSSGSSGGVMSGAQQVASFKQQQGLLPLPAVQLPPTSRAAL